MTYIKWRYIVIPVVLVVAIIIAMVFFQKWLHTPFDSRSLSMGENHYEPIDDYRWHYIKLDKDLGGLELDHSMRVWTLQNDPEHKFIQKVKFYASIGVSMEKKATFPCRN